ncbi:hypothetical protein EHS39_23065 [Ensifer sp. MPMI2T]|nr:hypothetical protein EHS39_23065 [Ensifer sp. MPMI2T]
MSHHRPCFRNVIARQRRGRERLLFLRRARKPSEEGSAWPWGNIAEAKFNAEYGARVKAIGQVHARIGLDPRWYIGGYALIAEHLIGEVVKAH